MDNILASDVSLQELMFFAGEKCFEVKNQKSKIRALLEKYPGWSLICEPTSTYHLELVQTALELGLTVYLVNPKEFQSYKNSMEFRAKTDKLDAEYLYEFLKRHRDRLRPWVPAPAEVTELRSLLRLRSLLVKQKPALFKPVRGMNARKPRLISPSLRRRLLLTTGRLKLWLVPFPSTIRY
jgi:transposase